MRLMVLAFAVVLTFVFMLSCVSDDSSADAYWYDSEEDILNVTSDISDFDESDDRSWDPYLSSATRYYYSATPPTSSGNYWHYVDGVLTEWIQKYSYTLLDDGTYSIAIKSE